MADKSEMDSAGILPGPISLLWRLIIAASLVPMGLFLFSQLSRFIFVAELVHNFRLQLTLALIPFAILSLGFRKSWFPVILIGTTIWCAYPIAISYVPALQPPPGPQRIKVMSHNVLGINRQYVDVIHQVREVDPDVLLVVEYSRNWLDALELLNEQFPYRIEQARWHGFGIGLFSKYPIEKQIVVQLTGDTTDNPLIVGHINIGNQTVRFAGLHSLSPTNRFRMNLRNQQFQDAAEYLKTSDLPTLVLGDFNCVPWSFFLHDFAQTTGYRDSRIGFGYQGSWPDFLPALIPIDHAFASRLIHVHTRRIGKRCGSDHCPIILEISVSE
ncbi:MAG: endonuclease/exonuclease/phosphatase family protein [Planctomycetota bacterium]